MVPGFKPPLVCLVTDRRRLGAAVDRDPLVRQVELAAAAGVGFVQVREPDLAAGALEALVRRVLVAVRGNATRILVNDRLDVALGAGAHGVHLRADSVEPDRARTLAPHGFVIGRSIHTGDEPRLAEWSKVCDFFIFGTVFRTISKPSDHEVAGIEGLARAVQSTTVPVMAIGGVTFDRLPEVAGAGAAGYAAISLFDRFAGSTDEVSELSAAIARAQRLFDSRGPVV